MLFFVGPFLCISFFFWKLCLVWTSLFSLFSPFTYTLSLFFTFFFFWIVPFVLSFLGVKKTVFLVCWSSKERKVPLCFLFLLVFSLLEKNCIIICFHLFLNFLFWTMSFFLFDFPWSPSQHVSFTMFSSPRYFLLSFILFPSVLSFLSPLVFSFLSPFSSLLFWTSFFGLFIIFMFLCVKHCAKKICIFLYCSKTLFFLSSLFHQKNSVFSVSFFVEPVFYIDLCSMFCLFLCLEKWFLILFHSF